MEAAPPIPQQSLCYTRIDSVVSYASIKGEVLQPLQTNGATITGEGTGRVFVQPTLPGAPIIQLWPEDRPHRWRDNLATNTYDK